MLLANSAEEGVLDLELKETDVMDLLRSVIERAKVQIAPDYLIELKGP